jgi:superfamily I DNA and RNA helicase
LAAVCFNRTLVPFIKKKIDIAYRQRTGQPIPHDSVEVLSYNGLMWHLSQKGIWRYQNVDSGEEAERARQYLRDLSHVKQNDPATFDRCCFDAIYVDEGQDFLEDDFRLLKELCRIDPDGEPSLFVFYDDAQNLYGRPRPNWSSLGLKIVGRSHIMSECFRNTRQIVEAAFNVLYGSFATETATVPTKAFGDIATLQEKGLLDRAAGAWKVRFAKRSGVIPTVTVEQGRHRQWDAIAERLRRLIEEQQVRPEDILLLAQYRNQVEQLVEVVEAARLPSVRGIHVATAKKDELLHQRGFLSISTVASAKGYDANCVLIASGNEFPTNEQGRVSFYVACTRAIECLDVFATSRSGLVVEMEKAVAALE